MKSFSSLLISFLLVISCTKRNSTIAESSYTLNNGLNNGWYLTKYEGGFSPTINYNIGDIKWNFNNNIIQVLIKNGVNASPSLPLNANGNYNCFIDTVNKKIVLNNVTFKYEISNSNLILDNKIP